LKYGAGEDTWNDHVRNEEVLHIVEEESYILLTMKKG